MLEHLDLAAWLALQVVVIRRSVIPCFSTSGLAMVTATSVDELVELLGDAAAEIASLDNSENPQCSRLHALQRELRPLKLRVDEFAKRIDVAPRDVLDASLAAGAREFWHQGQHFRSPAQLHTYLASEFLVDPVPELEVELTTDQAQRLADELDVAVQWHSFEKRPTLPHAEFEKILMDAAVEIATLDGTNNSIFRRLLTELQNQSQHQPMLDRESPVFAAGGGAKPPRKFTPSDSAAPARKADEKKQSG